MRRPVIWLLASMFVSRSLDFFSFTDTSALDGSETNTILDAWISGRCSSNGPKNSIGRKGESEVTDRVSQRRCKLGRSGADSRLCASMGTQNPTANIRTVATWAKLDLDIAIYRTRQCRRIGGGA